MSDVLFSVKKGEFGEIAFITLNRLKALNALTYEMINEIYLHLVTWEQQFNIKAVVVRSNSNKAFCAGGDVVKLHEINEHSPDKALSFFKNEYLLNCLIRKYKKPYICLLDGLTLGGGVGLSLHGSHPIATENFSFAMPETGIGFFPDVGGGYLLTRSLDFLGLYLGLTGKRIGRADAIASKLLKHRIDSNEQEAFIERLLNVNLATEAHKKIEDLLAGLSKSPLEKASLLANLSTINAVFSADSVREIFSRLTLLDCEWSKKTLKTLQLKSPIALLITFEHLKRVRHLSMEATMRIEFRMASAFLKNHDFSEGVRALLVDKDFNPHWENISFESDNQSLVEGYFQPLENELFTH